MGRHQHRARELAKGGDESVPGIPILLRRNDVDVRQRTCVTTWTASRPATTQATVARHRCPTAATRPSRRPSAPRPPPVPASRRWRNRPRGDGPTHDAASSPHRGRRRGRRRVAQTRPPPRRLGRRRGPSQATAATTTPADTANGTSRSSTRTPRASAGPRTGWAAVRRRSARTSRRSAGSRRSVDPTTPTPSVSGRADTTLPTSEREATAASARQPAGRSAW